MGYRGTAQFVCDPHFVATGDPRTPSGCGSLIFRNPAWLAAARSRRADVRARLSYGFALSGSRFARRARAARKLAPGGAKRHPEPIGVKIRTLKGCEGVWAAQQRVN